LHCDKTALHHLILILDEVFGIQNFKNEIIWHYKRWSSTKTALQSNHQTILFYSKSKLNKFNTLYTEYSPTTNIDQILQERKRNEHGSVVYKKNDDGTIVMAKEKKGVPLGDVWEMPYLNPKASGRVGYPTQKPILLLEQIIKIGTDENDIVFEPFCGSGTSLVVSKLLNRKYIGVDIFEEVCLLANMRLKNPIKTKSFLLEKGVTY